MRKCGLFRIQHPRNLNPGSRMSDTALHKQAGIYIQSSECMMRILDQDLCLLASRTLNAENDGSEIWPKNAGSWNGVLDPRNKRIDPGLSRIQDPGSQHPCPTANILPNGKLRTQRQTSYSTANFLLSGKNPQEIVNI